MSIVIDIPSELEAILRATASEAGVDLDDYIVKVLQNNFGEKNATLPSKEIELLQHINQGLTPESWTQFHALLYKRDTHSISDAELAELIELADTIEQAHAQRMEALAELAQLQKKSLKVLMNELGIGPVAYGVDKKN